MREEDDDGHDSGTGSAMKVFAAAAIGGMKVLVAHGSSLWFAGQG